MLSYLLPGGYPDHAPFKAIYNRIISMARYTASFPRTTSNSAVQDDGDYYKKWTTKQRRIGRYSLYDLLWWENTRAGACVLSSETSARVHRNTWLYPGCVMDHKVQCLSRQASFALLIHVFNRQGIILVFLDDEAVSEINAHSSCTHHPHI